MSSRKTAMAPSPYSVNYGVFFSRGGYAEIKAVSADEAMRIADETMKVEEVSWDEDWHPTDVQLEE